MDKFDVIITGAGPAGLFAAALCASEGLKTCILETNRSAGRKLLITGQGKCNITNTLEMSGFIKHYGNKTRFVRKCLYSFSSDALMKFIREHGLPLTVREDGKVFPESERASDVLNLFLGLCRKSDVRFLFNEKVSSVSASAVTGGSSGSSFTVSTDEMTLESSSLIIAAGGFTWPSTGSDGSGFRLAESLGHSITPPRPSLAAVIAVPEDYSALSICSGIAVECSLELFRDGAKKGSFGGRLLFTRSGLSGPVIIDNSRYFSAGDRLEINLMPGYDAGTLNSSLIDFCKARGKSMIKTMFTEAGLPDRLVTAVFQLMSLQADCRAAELSSSVRRTAAAAFTSLPVRVQALEGRKTAMCTAGGVDTAEINPATMESRIVPGLYFAGEVIDVDGDSGGFNLQFAFSSAHAAAGAVTERVKTKTKAE